MIDVNKAKQKILDLAIRGKLTKQHLKDGNINDEIIHYIDNVEMDNEYKKNKKQVKINTIEELPFDIPKTWSWVRLGNICSIFGRIGYRGYTKDDIVEEGNGAISLSPSNLIGFGNMDYSNCTYISWVKYNESPEIMINSEDIIIVKTGSSYGKTGYISYLQEKATINPQLAILKYLQGNKKYILIVLNTIFVKKQLDNFVLGSAVPTFSQEDLANLMIPLPTLAEQNRIVEKVDKLFEILDKIDEAQKKYQKDKEILKSKIIEAGIRGKLTKQLKSDGNASILLDEIRKEKEKLIKEGKIKGDKKETFIYKKHSDNLYYEKYQDGSEKCINDELPFEIPENWVWCRAKEIIEIKMGQSPRGININTQKGMEFHQGKIFFGDKFLKESNIYTKEITKIAKANSILLCVRAPVGDLNITKRDVCIGRGLCALKPYYSMSNNYVYYVFSLLKKYFNDNSTGATFDAISNDVILGTLIPLPPLSEQERIVKCIEGILMNFDILSN